MIRSIVNRYRIMIPRSGLKCKQRAVSRSLFQTNPETAPLQKTRGWFERTLRAVFGIYEGKRFFLRFQNLHILVDLDLDSLRNFADQSSVTEFAGIRPVLR